MALNLVRNSKVFFTTNVDSITAGLPTSGYGNKNTFELQILDGFSFSQNTNSETVTLNESGTTPVRGQRSFNTSLAPVDFSFSTYIRPKNTGTLITAEESILWNALFTSKPITDSTKVTIGTGGSGVVSSITYNETTGLLTINSTALNLPSTSFTAGDAVIVGGLTTSPAGSGVQINTYGTIVTSTTGSITLTITGFTTTPTTITTPTTMTLTKQGVSQAAKIGSGGTGSITTATYAYTPGAGGVSGYGTITVVGTGLPIYSAGEVVVLSGFTGTVAGTALAGTATPTLNLFNQPAVVRSLSTATGMILDVLTPFAGSATLTPAYTTTSSFTIARSAWSENGTSFSLVSTASSDINQLQKFGMLFLVDNIMYGIENCVLSQASIDFSIDGIATIAWTGQGALLKRMSTVNAATAGTNAGLFTGTMIYGGYRVKDTAANYISNRLSTVSLTSMNVVKNKLGTTILAKDDNFPLAITGGNITINNNITYLTPELLGTVNSPATYFQGTRAISGSLTAYLKTGLTGDVGDLLFKLLDTSSANTELMMSSVVNIGGPTGTRVVLDMPGTVLTIPTVDVQQVVSTTINFTAEGSAPDSVSTFDLTEENDLTVRYYS